MALLSDSRRSNQIRLILMFTLTASFFLIEIIVGYLSNCMALVADSFHMLSDVVALVVAFVAVLVAPKEWSKSTFGWARAEVLGALINSVFLLALCFSIVVESLKRVSHLEPVENPLLVFIVGLIGLVVNLLGLALFGGHSHHGHSHGHDHHDDAGHHKHDHCHGNEMQMPNGVGDHEVLKIGMKHCSLKADLSTRSINSYMLKDGAVSPADLSNDQCGKEFCDDEIAGTPAKVMESTSISDTKIVLESPKRLSSKGTISGSQFIHPTPVTPEKARNMNMQGVFLHVLGDALGSVIVVISAGLIEWSPWEFKHYLDPALSIIMAIIITRATLPLLIESSLILLQTIPGHIDLEGIKLSILAIEGVHGVHELHVWRLTSERVIASAHITFTSLEVYDQISSKIKRLFHDEGIQSTTIQPEVLEGHPKRNSTIGAGEYAAEDYRDPPPCLSNIDEKIGRKKQRCMNQMNGDAKLDSQPLNGRTEQRKARKRENSAESINTLDATGSPLNLTEQSNNDGRSRLQKIIDSIFTTSPSPSPMRATCASDGNVSGGEGVESPKETYRRKSAM